MEHEETSEIRNLRRQGASEGEIRLRTLEIELARIDERVKSLSFVAKFGFTLVTGLMVSGFAAVMAMISRGH